MAEARDQLQKLTECCICFKTFADPRMLPCIHTFCLECLEKTDKATKKKDGENMPCPLCRKLFVIPTVGMKGLQRNFFMQHLIDVTDMMQIGQKLITNCDICKALHEGEEENTKEASMRCLECGDNFCDMCARTHKLHKSSKAHSVVKIGRETEDDIRKMQPTRNCAVHNQQPLSFYCADCKKVICVSCFVENHASHKCKDVTSVEKEFRKMIETNALTMSSCAEEILNKGCTAEQRTEEFLLKLADVEKDIRKRNLELKDMIDSHTNSLLGQLTQIKQKHVKDIAIDKEEVEHNYAVLKSFETYCTELRSKGSTYDICDCVDQLVVRAKELEKDHEAFIGRPFKKTEVSFKTTNLEELLSTSRGNIVGKVEEETLQQGLGKAVIQCLCKTFPLSEVLCSGTILEQPLTKAFASLLNHMHKNSPEQNEAFSKFLEQLYKSSPKCKNLTQHDIHNQFIQFLKELKSEETRSVVQSPGRNVNPKMALTAVDQVFGGHIITMYICLKCNQSNFVCKCLLDITLPIFLLTQQHHQNYSEVKAGMSNQRLVNQSRTAQADRYQNLVPYYENPRFLTDKSHTTALTALKEEQNKLIIPTDGKGRYRERPAAITDCLRLYTLTEHIPEGHRCWSCQSIHKADATVNAQTTTPAMKRTLIYNPPAVLVLHLKRFEKTTTGFTKRSDRVTYEEYLDLGPYCSSDCLRIGPEEKNVWYSLYGVVVHNGSVESGHYAAYVKVREPNPHATQTYLQKTYIVCDDVSSQQLQKMHSPSRASYSKQREWQPTPSTDGRWSFTDDDNTRCATLREALNQEAFMLFYERVKRDQLPSFQDVDKDVDYFDDQLRSFQDVNEDDEYYGD